MSDADKAKMIMEDIIEVLKKAGYRCGFISMKVSDDLKEVTINNATLVVSSPRLDSDAESLCLKCEYGSHGKPGYTCPYRHMLGGMEHITSCRVMDSKEAQVLVPGGEPEDGEPVVTSTRAVADVIVTDYSKMTDEEFVTILYELMEGMSIAEIMTAPGAYDVFSEHLNNRVLQAWAERNPDKAWPSESEGW